jgi:hypothetical protein
MKNETVTRRTVRGSSVNLGATLLRNPIPQDLAAG